MVNFIIMSNSSQTDDLITLDDTESFSSTFSTNPFLDPSWGGDEKFAGIVSSVECKGAVGGVNGGAEGGSDGFDSKLERLINAMTRLTDRDDGGGNRDIRHIDVFSGEGSDLAVVSRLKTYVADFDDFFENRKLNENDKLAYAKQKLSGAAKSLINSSRPRTYMQLRTLLYDSFAQIHMGQEELLLELRNLKLKEKEGFRQFSIRVIELAKVVAFKLECSICDKIVFDSLSKALLSKFEPYVNVQSQVKRAVKDRLPQFLVNELCDLMETDSRVFIGNERKGNTVKGGTKNINVVNVNTNSNSLCGHCFREGHVVSNCELLQNMNSASQRKEDFFSRRPT